MKSGVAFPFLLLLLFLVAYDFVSVRGTDAAAVEGSAGEELGGKQAVMQ